MTTDYKPTVFLPRTDFPMRARLPETEPGILARWERAGLYRRLRDQSRGREKFVLHDGPPYANGNLHIGHALNKILKDLINRSQQMLGRDANYVPGWDCHGLPIEWKIEEQYRAEGRDKDAVPKIEFRAECRAFAEHWIAVQREEFKRLGVIGDWDGAYTTMSHAAEAQIVRELHKFAMNGLLYRGSKPVMWSVVEKTALAEAEVEYHDFVSDQIWVRFPVIGRRQEGRTVPADAPIAGASVVIWTTTPWTIPGNRAIAFSPNIAYGLYEVTQAPPDNWLKTGDRVIAALATEGQEGSLVAQMMTAARVEEWKLLTPVSEVASLVCAHPLRETVPGYGFDVPLLEGAHVTDDVGTGFVHTAPGHGGDDFEVWTANKARLEERGIDTRIPYAVDENGAFTDDAPGFTGKRVLTDEGEKGDANAAVIAALAAAGMLVARSTLTHQYPHSWRSKKPVIFRNTPQWFIAMDRAYGDEGWTLRDVALAAIDATAFYPPSGRNRLRGMIEHRPDWVISRQRAWGVPIAVFVDRRTGEPLRDPGVNARIAEAFAAEGADAWFASGPERFLGEAYDAADYEQVTDILDVWFDSGATHAYVLETRADLTWPASLYLEGSDQHRGWFHSSLLESCGTRGRAPYDGVLTHGFVLAEDRAKMSKSTGNILAPQEIVDTSGADILRLWVVASDYSEDLRIGPEIVSHLVDAYRRLRNTFRYMLGNLADFGADERVEAAAMPELERWVLHRLWELDGRVRAGCEAFDFHDLFTALHAFCANDLSAFYFDVRKDALYCARRDDPTRRAARTVLDELFSCLTAWLAPIIAFTAEEAWLARHGEDAGSVHERHFPEVPAAWRDDELAERWAMVRAVRRVVTGALEIERAEKRIGASLQAHPTVYVDAAHAAPLAGFDAAALADIAITSALTVVEGPPPDGAFTLPEVPGVGVVVGLAEGAKCARCYKLLPEVGTIAGHEPLCGRCADAVAHFGAAAE